MSLAPEDSASAHLREVTLGSLCFILRSERLILRILRAGNWCDKDTSGPLKGWRESSCRGEGRENGK